MRKMLVLLALLGFVALTVFPLPHVEAEPFAQTQFVRGEIVALHGTTPRLLVDPVRQIKAVYSFDRNGVRTDYVEGVDWVRSGIGIARTSGSPIYDFDNYSVIMNPPTYTKFTWVGEPRNPPLVLYRQTYADYVADKGPVTIPALASAPITGKILAAGDSITSAAHTIAREMRSTDEDNYVGLLRDQFNRDFAVRNFSLSGSSIPLLINELPTILQDPPSVIIIAFGMNDHSGGDLPGFKANLTSAVQDIHAAGSQAILVGFFRKNPEWEKYSLPDVLAFNQAIQDVATAAGSPFVDIDQAFLNARAAGKTLTELLGDNYHHPSNYGQRIYFSRILPHLLTEPRSSSDVPAYLDF